MFNRISLFGLVFACVLALLLPGPVESGHAPERRRAIADFLHPTPIQPGFASVHRPSEPREVTFGPLLLAQGAVPGPVGDGLAWLESDQNMDGSWDDVFPMIVTPTAIESLTAIDPDSGARGSGVSWLSGQTAPNYDLLARQIAALAGIAGYEAQVSSLAADLLAARNPATTNMALPNWPEGGWGLADGFETDSLTTALALNALNQSGFNGGLKVLNRVVSPATTNTHEWDIAADAVKARILITVSGSAIRLRMKEGTPPGPGDPFFGLDPGFTYLIVFPDSGLPFTPGHNFIRIQNVTGTPATYTMTASYETPAFDTRALDEALEYLRQSQNVDGGWGLQRGQASEIYTTMHVIPTLLDFLRYDFAAGVASGADYVRSQQLGDGSFGYGGTPVPYVTALATLSLVGSQSYPFDTETVDAINALSDQQELDGSWAGEAYDTALAILALWNKNQPPTADAGPDQNITDVDEDCVEEVTLAGSGDDIDGVVVSVIWTIDGVDIATGFTPTVTLPVGSHVLVLTVTDNEGRSTSDSVTINIVGTGIPSDECHCCLPGGGCEPFDPIECPASGGTPVPGACVLEACCLDGGPCALLDSACCLQEGGTPMPGDVCHDPLGFTLTCCLPDGECVILDPLCCVLEGGNPQDQFIDFCTAPEACCLPDGTCQELDPLCCEEHGGAPRGFGSECAASEACCLPDDTCETIEPLCCVDLGGSPQGSGTSCATAEACCLPDGTCQLLDPVCCNALGGLSLGMGSACQGIGACCRADGSCTIADGACCSEDGDAPQEPGTPCDAEVACCYDDGSCVDLAPVCCNHTEGLPQAAGSFCLGDADEDGIDDACMLVPNPPELSGDDTCSGGSNDGGPCSTHLDCPNGVCGLKNRYITIAPPPVLAARGDPSPSTVQVCIDSMPLFPSQVGECWWAGIEQPIQGTLRGAPLQCTPHAAEWVAEPLHLFGEAIIPDSTYEVRMCDDAGLNCSDPLVVGTAKWGDVVAPFGGSNQPNINDLQAVVSRFQGVATAPNVTRTDLVGAGNPGNPNMPNVLVNISDVQAAVDAFRGIAYPYTVTPCP